MRVQNCPEWLKYSVDAFMLLKWNIVYCRLFEVPLDASLRLEDVKKATQFCVVLLT